MRLSSRKIFLFVRVCKRASDSDLLRRNAFNRHIESSGLCGRRILDRSRRHDRIGSSIISIRIDAMSRERNPVLEERHFEGRRYTRKLGRRYFYCNEWDKRTKKYIYYALHREVWKSAHGPIPIGYDIHHKDENSDNNETDNLECSAKGDHRKLHCRSPEVREAMRIAFWRNFEAFRAAALEANRKPKQHECPICRHKFTSTSNNAKFCKQQACRSNRIRNRRRARRAGLRFD